MPFAKFCIYSFLGSLPWCILLAYVGTIIGDNLEQLTPIFHNLDIVILVLLVALIVLYVWRHLRNDRRAREAHGTVQQARLDVSEQKTTQQPRV
jgi:membrane protein DedA with SNARE-associated domain